MAGGSLWAASLLICFLSPFSMTVTVVTGCNQTKGFMLLSREASVVRDEEGVLKLLPDVSQKLQLIGMNLSDGLEIAFTPENKQNCDTSKRTEAFKPTSTNNRRTSAMFEVTLDKLDPGEERYHLCVKQSQTWEFHGCEPWQQIAIEEVAEESGSIFPVPVQVVIITCLLFLSGLFSGLNLGLMALDKTELQIIEKCGSKNEKKYAKTITPLRKRGNFLLCTLLLGNVMVNNTATILLDDLSNGVVAVVVSTMCIVVFGEIIPQAVCSRHGLAVGARTAWITRFFMVITFPLSFPISLLLDKILGEEIGQVYDKERLQELIRMTADNKVLQSDEVNIISGALQLATKRVEDVMTKIEDVYMLDVNTILDFEMMSAILKSGYTRVPVHDGDLTNIVHLLNTKELALIDPDNKTPLRTVCRFYNHQPLFVDYDMKLDAMLQEFLQGNSHMAIVQCLRSEDDRDPYYENIGVVTLEDVIEEIIQSEIIDETDILTDNRRKKAPQRNRELEYNVFDQKHEHTPRISQQVAFAAYQFLSTAVEPFKEQYIVRNVLKQLIRQNIFLTLTPDTEEDNERNYLYKRGKDCDYFILLLEGHVEVEIGRENLVFESGAFTYFGTECLDCLRDIKIESFRDSKDLRALPPYTPDFSVRALSTVQYLRIRRVHYLAARRTSCMMCSRQEGEDACHEEAFHNEWRRTLAASTISRNSSTAGMCDMVSESSLSPLEMVQKRALMSESSLKDRFQASNSSPHHPASMEDLEARGEKALVEGREEKARADSINTHSSKGSLISSGSADHRARLQIVPSENSETASPSVLKKEAIVEDKGGQGGGLLTGDMGCGDEVQSLAADPECNASPEERGVGKEMGDRVPLVSVKDERTTLSGRKGLAGEEDESSPLVGKETAYNQTVHS